MKTLLKNRELPVLLVMLFLYSAVCFLTRNWYDVFWDDPAYTDPAASFIFGQGFTSGCWYAQEYAEFWAGNVPLHQFLLVPWLKVFGFSHGAVQSLNLLYIALGMGFLWSGLRRSELVPCPFWRLGLIGFFLMSDVSLRLAFNGRPEPICLLIVCVSWFGMTLQDKQHRFLLVGFCGFLAPWGSLALSLCFAFAGALVVVFYRKSYLKEVAALGLGGVIGSLALLLFYQRMGVLDDFVASILPHMAGTEVAGFRQVSQHRYGVFRCATILLTVALSIWAGYLAYSNKRCEIRALLNLACIIGIPTILILSGVFPAYYGVYLFIPTAVLLFSILSDHEIRKTGGAKAMILILWLSAVMPGSFLHRMVQGTAGLSTQAIERNDSFARKVLRADDTAWLDYHFWYAAKPIAKYTFSGIWHGKSSKDLTVAILTPKEFAKAQESFLKGEWKPTGEFLDVPNRWIYRDPLFLPGISKIPLLHYEVYRRVDKF